MYKRFVTSSGNEVFSLLANILSQTLPIKITPRIFFSTQKESLRIYQGLCPPNNNFFLAMRYMGLYINSVVNHRVFCVRVQADH